MLWAVLFFIMGVVLAIWGFGGIAIAVSPLSKTLFYLSGICFFITTVWVGFFMIRHWKKKALKED